MQWTRVIRCFSLPEMRRHIVLVDAAPRPVALILAYAGKMSRPLLPWKGAEECRPVWASPCRSARSPPPCPSCLVDLWREPADRR